MLSTSTARVAAHIRELAPLVVFVRELEGARLADAGRDACDVRFERGVERGEVRVVGLEVEVEVDGRSLLLSLSWFWTGCRWAGSLVVDQVCAAVRSRVG